MKVKKMRQTSTESLIISAFVNLLLKEDIDQISIKEITQAANVNRATFYAHFQDKYQLFDVIIHDSIKDRLSNNISNSKGLTKEVISDYFQSVLDYLQVIKDHCPYSYKTLLPKVRLEILNTLKGGLAQTIDSNARTKQRLFHIQLAAGIIYDAAESSLMSTTSLTQPEIMLEINAIISKLDESVSNNKMQ